MHFPLIVIIHFVIASKLTDYNLNSGIHFYDCELICLIWCISACIDHRGTPEHPARTCTLEENEGAICVSDKIFNFLPNLLPLSNFRAFFCMKVVIFSFDSFYSGVQHIAFVVGRRRKRRRWRYYFISMIIWLIYILQNVDYSQWLIEMLYQYLERRECEYDRKTLVDFYKVRNVFQFNLFFVC